MKKDIIQRLKTIDCTPTWESLVRSMLEKYQCDCAKVNAGSAGWMESAGDAALLEMEFIKMAKAADAYINITKQTIN